MKKPLSQKKALVIVCILLPFLLVAFNLISKKQRHNKYTIDKICGLIDKNENTDFLIKEIECGKLAYLRDSYGLSLLHHAAASSSYEICHYLLEKGVDPNVEDANGVTPILYYCGRPVRAISECFDHRIVIDLIAHGAKVNVCTKDTGVTPLIASFSYDDVDLTRILLKAGADVNARTLDGTSAIFFSCTIPTTSKSAISITSMLIDYGADINSMDCISPNDKNEKETVLSSLVFLKKNKLAKLLFDRGASPDIINSDGTTARTIAKEENKEMYDYFNKK